MNQTYTTTAAVKKGKVAYLTPSGKVSPHPGPMENDGKGGVFYKPKYTPIGIFSKSAAKGKIAVVSVDGEGAHAKMNEPEIDLIDVMADNKTLFKKLLTTPPVPWDDDEEESDEFQIDDAEAADQITALKQQVQTLTALLEEQKGVTAYWQKQSTNAFASLAELKEAEQKVAFQKVTLPPEGLPDDYKNAIKKAKELSPIKTQNVFRKSEKLTINIKESLAGAPPAPCPPEDANLISSELMGTKGYHVPVLDIDLPCRLVPSSQKGHYHLYISQMLDWPTYVKLLECLRDVGICQQGFVDASIKRGFSSVRPPWVKKTAQEIAEGSSD